MFQTYVEKLKNEGKFDLEAQKTALSLATEKVFGELKEDAKEFITANFGDIGTWITTQIEAAIYELKK